MGVTEMINVFCKKDNQIGIAFANKRPNNLHSASPLSHKKVDCKIIDYND